ncbi:hypothetical protein VTN96DRAFT_8488 [Rasamsonia emersonii]
MSTNKPGNTGHQDCGIFGRHHDEEGLERAHIQTRIVDSCLDIASVSNSYGSDSVILIFGWTISEKLEMHRQ